MVTHDELELLQAEMQGGGGMPEPEIGPMGPGAAVSRSINDERSGITASNRGHSNSVNVEAVLVSGGRFPV
jgi:hypothetical protein